MIAPRFTTIDPLAENYYSISPYVYCAGNPVIFIDPTGMKPVWNGKYGDESAYVDDEDENKTYSWDEVQKEYGMGGPDDPPSGANPDPGSFLLDNWEKFVEGSCTYFENMFNAAVELLSYTDADDAAVLLTGHHVTLEEASKLDYGLASVSIFLPISGKTLFRGVKFGNNAGYRNALSGKVVPKGWGLKLPQSLSLYQIRQLHSYRPGATVFSPYSSWTEDLDIAKKFAGEKGVILKTTIPSLDKRLYKARIDEKEWLIYGPLDNLEKVE